MRVAVLGTGRMGLRHMRVVCQLGWEVVGILDSSPETLAVAGNQFGIPTSRQYHDPERLFDEAKPECVIVSTTAPGHAQLTCRAAAGGAKFVLCEKPMATSLAECDRMIQACKLHGARLAINHQMRFMPQYLAARHILESDEFGPWTSITVIAGNMGMATNGTHYFELMRWLSDETAATVAAWLSADSSPNPRGAQWQDMAGSVRVSTPSGKRLYMDIGADQGHGIRVVYAGRTGLLVADEISGQMQLSVRGAEHRRLSTARYATESCDSSPQSSPTDVMAPTRSVIEALIANRDYPSGEQGRAAIATLVAAHVSDRDGHRPVNIDAALPRGMSFPYP